MSLSRQEAEKLISDLKEREISLGRDPATWFTYENHVYGAANVAQTIATHTGMDPDKAYISALLHDICRTEENRNQRFHGIMGYEKLKQLDETAARSALVHMFQWYYLPAFEEASKTFFGNKQDYDFVADFMKKNPLSDIDLLVQLSDSMANKDGIVTIEERMRDLAERGRLSPNQNLEQSAKRIKKHFDEKTGRDIYELFW